MTPLLEEDEQHQDEDIPHSDLPTLHPMETKPSTGSPLRDNVGNIRDSETRTLLHPHEAARQARAFSARHEEEDVTGTSRETTVKTSKYFSLEMNRTNYVLRADRLGCNEI